MFSSFSPNLVRPNRPLRQPSSNPVALCASPTPAPVAQPFVSPARPATAGAIGNGHGNSSINKEAFVMPGCVAQASTLHYCNYCGQQGQFRCKRCKKTLYCSVACQTEDWKAHRHMCQPVDPEPVQENPTDSTLPLVTVERAGLLGSKPSEPGHQRVFLQDLQMLKVEGTEIQASVVEFYNPGRFFLLSQSPEVMTTLQTISMELQKTYSCPPAMTYIPCAGEVCAVQFSSDMNWYRGLVQTLATDQKKANILYIDFGNEEDVPVERIRPLAAKIPPFFPCAMECCIAGVVPLADDWSTECCMTVRQLLVGKTVKVKLVETPESARIHAVDILLSQGKQLSTFLIEHSYAAERNNNTTPSEQEIYAMMNASLENFKRLSNGKDDNTWAQPPDALTQALGDSFSVVVTHLPSPSEIIVQKVENAGVIQELQMKLREHCSQVPAPQNFRPAPGTVCCAQFSEDKQWYRAKVLAYSSEERVCVGYLDFGNSEEVDISHLRPISSSLLALPMQAIPCALAGLQPVGESWSEECILALQRRVSNRILRIEIQGAHEGKALVALIDEASDPQANVGELLTSAGFSAPAPVASSSDQQAKHKAVVSTEAQGACGHLVWSQAELPCDGQTVALLISAVENPKEFYCRISNPADHQRLTELGAELKQHCVANASPFVPKVGEPCCAMFPDGAWYRAMVNELSEDKVSVNFVDYGNSMKLDKNCLRPITPQLLTLPFQAIRCSLAGVEPLGSEWSSEALLCFQNLVDGKQLSARALSLSEKGYKVKLESRGQDVAAALISEQLAKVPGASVKEAHVPPGAEPQVKEDIKGCEQSQEHVQASPKTGAIPQDVPTAGTGTVSEAPSFPVNWKTVALPLNENFQPCIAAAVSPSLLYLLLPGQMDQQKLQGVMMQLAAHCRSSSSSLSSCDLSGLATGAACCAQFSGDNNWYRAVVLEVGEQEISVLYADYGNTEKIPFSHIVPIPAHLLQLPFQITRCTLAGKEHFPAEWPQEVLQTFKNLLSKGVVATVQDFDGFANVLSLNMYTESDGGHVSAMIMDALRAQVENKLMRTSINRAAEQNDGNPSAAVLVCPQPELIPKTEKGQGGAPDTGTGQTVGPGMGAWASQQDKNTSAVLAIENPVQIIKQVEAPSANDAETEDLVKSGCCCQSLKTKMDHLEQLIQQHLSLLKEFVGQK